MWSSHYIHRGWIHPWIMRYSSATTPLGICVSGLFANTIYSVINAHQIATTPYTEIDGFPCPRFMLGTFLFVTGYIINRVSDFQLRALRKNENDKTYKIPTGFMFEYVTCPNYLGEWIEWCGYALAAWSWPSFVWMLFGAATFFARSPQAHEWYKKKFSNYPKNRKRLIPFIF